MAWSPPVDSGPLTGHTSSELLWLAVPLPLEAGKGLVHSQGCRHWGGVTCPGW